MGTFHGRTGSGSGNTRDHSDASSASSNGVTGTSNSPAGPPPPRSRIRACASRAVHARTFGKSPTLPWAPSGVRRWVTITTKLEAAGDAEYGSAVTSQDSVAMSLPCQAA